MNGGGQQNGVPMVNGLPSGGQQTDINHLWAVVQQLSQLLEENKAQTQGIVNGVAAIQGRAAEEGGGAVGGMGIREVNGEISGMCCYSVVWVDERLTRQYSSATSRRTRPPPIPTLDRANYRLRPHRNKHIFLHTHHRLRVCAHPPARQTASVRIRPNLRHPRPTQTLPDPAGPRAHNEHDIAARACRLAGGIEPSSGEREGGVARAERGGRGAAEGVQGVGGGEQGVETDGGVGGEAGE